MRRLREIWDDPNTWRWTQGDSFGSFIVGCMVEEVLALVLVLGIGWLLYTSFTR